MKMTFLFTGLFWGVVLVLLGVSVIINVVFNVHIPLFRILLGLIIIYFGVKVMMGSSWQRNCPTPAMFTEQKWTPTAKATSDYNVVFGKGVVDLTSLPVPAQDSQLSLSTVFGYTEVVLKPEIPVRIKVNAAFSGATLPDGAIISFGQYVYTSPAFDPAKPAWQIDASVVFGGIGFRSH